jgi:preprotein translocase SecF subunit
MFELVPQGTNVNFVGTWRVWATISLVLLLTFAAAVPVRGIRLGVDFAGGTLVVVGLPDPTADEGFVRSTLERLELRDATVIRVKDPEQALFQVHLPPPKGDSDIGPDRLVPLLEKELGGSAGPATVESVDFVGPRIGSDLRNAAINSLAISFLLILIYVAFRFSPAYAPGAVIALVHDVWFTAGVFVVMGWEFDLNVIAALLTIIGYSLNDTIVIYDRMRENRASRTDAHLEEVVNRSMNETLSRTVLTAGATLLSLIALFAVGGPALRGFSVAMIIGVVVGTYSTLYVAAPFVLLIEGFQARRKRSKVEARTARPPAKPAKRAQGRS